MKKNLILPLVLSASALLVASCGAPATSESSKDSSQESSASSAEPSSEPSSEATSEYIPQYDVAELVDPAPDFSGIKGVPGGASGATSLVGESVANKTKILGALEKYAVDNAVTGMPLFENGGYVMYNPRIVKGTENYITGYGFGIIREGRLTEDLYGVPKPSYYHTYESSDPQTINYLDNDGAQVGDLYGNVAAAYFGTKMNSKKNGYDWYGLLSKKDRPVLLDKDGKPAADQNGTGDKWRIYVRTNDEGVTYRTKSAKADRLAFDGTKVQLQDYIDAFRILLCGKFAYYRGTEFAGQTGYSGIKGAAAYYNASKAGLESEAATKAWKDVGIVSGTDEEGDYLDFTLLAPTTRFYAMYSLGSNLYAPINMDFFKLVTEDLAHPEFYGSFNSDKSASPVDNFLSTGPYMLESWETDKSIVFGRNDDWFECNGEVYQIPGIYNAILPAIDTDANAAIKEFLLGTIDSCGIPTDFLAKFKDDPRTTSVPGDSVFKLNLNTTTKDQWVKLFGKEGTIAQTPESNYWDVKPWMSNKDFVKGLFFSIDRDEFATKNGSISSINYFSSNYMSDPENGISYNTTDEHAAALTDFWGSTVDKGGFSSALAEESFDKATKALLDAGTIKAKQELTIDIWWMYTNHITRYGEDIGKYIQDAFNAGATAKANEITLKVNNLAVDVWSDVYYKHLMVGQFDLGFGSVSGNSLDPLNFMEVLKSDNSSGFTLNWGPDTSALDLNFDDKVWSFDTLWAAADHGVVTYKGQTLPPVIVEWGKGEFDEDGNLAVTFTMTTAKYYMSQLDDTEAAKIAALTDEEYSVSLDAVYITDWTTAKINGAFDKEGNPVLDDDYTGFIESFDLKSEGNGGKLTATFVMTYDLLEFFADGGEGAYLYFGADVTQNILGIESAYETEGVFVYLDSSAM